MVAVGFRGQRADLGMEATAAVVRGKEQPFEVERVKIGELRADEVLVRVVACGVCHTDLICRDQWNPVPLPSIFGHEGSGIVEQVGPLGCGIQTEAGGVLNIPEARGRVEHRRLRHGNGRDGRDHGGQGRWVRDHRRRRRQAE